MKITTVRKNGRRQWRVSYQDVGDQRRRFFKSRADADEFAGGLADVADPAFKRWANLPEVARFDALNAAERAGRGGYSLTDAVAHYEGTHAGLVKVPIREAWAEYFDLKTNHQNASPDTIRNASIARRFLENHESRAVSDLGAVDVIEYLRAMKWAASSKNSFLTQLNIFLNWCHAAGYLGKLPTAGIPRAIADPAEVGILDAQQSESLIRACEQHDPGLVPIVALGLFCGLRPSESQRIRWDNIDFRQKNVDLTALIARKTRRNRLVELQPNAFAWLKLKGDLPAANFRRRWDSVREHAGLVNRIRIPGQKRYVLEIVHFPKDCLRHSFASHFIPLFGRAECAEQCGNSESVLIRHYRKPLPKEDCRKYFGIRPAV